MAIRGIIFDIGGVLEITPDLGIDAEWEKKLGLEPGEMNKRLGRVWSDGGIGLISEQEVHQKIGALLGISDEQVNAYMADVWRDYLGTLNVELTEYFKNLRPKYQTAIISNSFVGAREREQANYHFDEICDFIVYSHEVGMRKPAPRIYEIALERLGLRPEEVIFLDDRDGAVDPACELGIHGILFKDTQQAIADIEACIKRNAE